MRGLIFAILLFFITTTASAQEISKETLTKRLAELEQTKIQLEQAYMEVVARINELKYLLTPQEEKDEQGSNPKSDENMVK